jgi:hypothetical protein
MKIHRGQLNKLTLEIFLVNYYLTLFFNLDPSKRKFLAPSLLKSSLLKVDIIFNYFCTWISEDESHR